MNASPSIDYSHNISSAIEIEAALIGACLMNADAATRALSIASPPHFHEPLHQAIWSAIQEATEQGRPANALTICAMLGNAQIDPSLDLKKYIARCAADTHCVPAHVPDFARQVRDLWALREIAQASAEIQAYALQPGAHVRDLISDTIQRFDTTRSIIDGKSVSGRMLVDGTDRTLERMDRRTAGEALDLAIPTGLKDLDRKLNGGFAPGQLILIAGRPGMGKTTVAVSLSRQMARGHAGAFFSLEMPEEQISARFIADEAYSGPSSVNAGQIIAGAVTQGQAEHLHANGRAFRDMPLAIDDSPSLTVGEIGARARTIKSRFARMGRELQFIVIDYLKFVKASERYRGQRHYEVGEISGGLKSLAKDLNIAVILLVQLNREVEKRQDKRPELSDLRESGDLEADADVVLLLFREAYYLANDKGADAVSVQDAENKLEIIIAKQRMGQTGSVDVFCHVGASALRDLGRS